MRTRLTILLIFFMAACTSTPARQSTTISTTPVTANPSAYPDLGAAPEIVGEVWLNTAAPLRLVDLRGKIILIDMWTYG